MTPLHLAAWSGKVEVARLLLEARAEVNSCSQNGDTPLILACQHGNSDVVSAQIYLSVAWRRSNVQLERLIKSGPRRLFIARFCKTLNDLENSILNILLSQVAAAIN